LGATAAEASRIFRALAAENRVRLLQTLSEPTPVSEIELAPSRERSDLSSDRTLSRQAVKQHLDRLREVGLVRQVDETRNGRTVQAYVTDFDVMANVLGDLSDALYPT
jgi:DNA-binding transcriptional ArsR family regulator